MSELVRYKNDMNKIKLSNLTPKEQDIFFSILYKAQTKENKIIILFDELKVLANKEKNKKELIKNIEGLSEKLASITQKMILPNGDIMIFSIFRNFLISPERNVLEVNIGEEFKYIIKELFGGTYTQFELRHLVELKSSYSKTLFRLLKQWSSTGEYYISLKEFREILNVPETYDTTNFNKRVLAPILDELPRYFKNLKIEKIKKGRSIDRFKFKWDVKNVEVIKKYEEVDEKISSEKIALKASIPVLNDKDIEVLLKSAEMSTILEKYYTLAVGKEIENLTGFLLSAIKNDWKTVSQAEKEFKKETGEMDELEAKIQKRLYLKLAEKEKNKDSQNH